MKKSVRIISYILVIIGAINWGLIGLLDFDLVATIFGDMSIMSRTVYSLVGLSAIVSLLTIYELLFREDIER